MIESTHLEISDHSDGESIDSSDFFSDGEGEDEMDRFEIDEKQKQFKLFLEQKALEEANFHIDFD